MEEQFENNHDLLQQLQYQYKQQFDNYQSQQNPNTNFDDTHQHQYMHKHQQNINNSSNLNSIHGTPQRQVSAPIAQNSQFQTETQQKLNELLQKPILSGQSYQPNNTQMSFNQQNNMRLGSQTQQFQNLQNQSEGNAQNYDFLTSTSQLNQKLGTGIHSKTQTYINNNFHSDNALLTKTQQFQTSNITQRNPTLKQQQTQEQKQQLLINQAFIKYDQGNKNYLTKLEFKCAFIYLTGMKPSKDDMLLVKQFTSSIQQRETTFMIGLQQFSQLMTLYLQQISQQNLSQNTLNLKGNQSSSAGKLLSTQYQSQNEMIEQAWILMDGKERGFITIRDYYEQYDKCMPLFADRDVAIEMFMEIDSDRDGKLTYKDFYEAIMFEL